MNNNEPVKLTLNPWIISINFEFYLCFRSCGALKTSQETPVSTDDRPPPASDNASRTHPEARQTDYVVFLHRVHVLGGSPPKRLDVIDRLTPTLTGDEIS